jgi:hypothetical protein
LVAGLYLAIVVLLLGDGLFELHLLLLGS